VSKHLSDESTNFTLSSDGGHNENDGLFSQLEMLVLRQNLENDTKSMSTMSSLISFGDMHEISITKSDMPQMFYSRRRSTPLGERQSSKAAAASIRIVRHRHTRDAQRQRVWRMQTVLNQLTMQRKRKLQQTIG
jgi:hypothetical protein